MFDFELCSTCTRWETSNCLCDCATSLCVCRIWSTLSFTFRPIWKLNANLSLYSESKWCANGPEVFRPRSRGMLGGCITCENVLINQEACVHRQMVFTPPFIYFKEDDTSQHPLRLYRTARWMRWIIQCHKRLAYLLISYFTLSNSFSHCLIWPHLMQPVTP